MKKAMIIANPSSGKEEAQGYVEKIQHQLANIGYTTDIRLTSQAGDAAAWSAEAAAARLDMVVSIGGDGTLNEVVNGLAEKEHRPTLGVIPLGTVNDFARALQVPLEPAEAMAVIGRARLQKADVGKVNERYFLNIVALGDIAESAAVVSPEKKTALGSFAYFLEGGKGLVNKQPVTISVTADEEEWKGEALLFLAALTNSVGGFESVAPDAEVHDGKLHCFIIRKASLPKLVRMTANLLKGELNEDPDVVYFRTSRVKVASEALLKANVDGDIVSGLPLTLEVLPRHIEVWVP